MKKIPEGADFLRQPISVGDLVAGVAHGDLYLGKVGKVTPKGAQIIIHGRKSTLFATSSKFVKITHQYNLFLEEYPERLI